MHKAVHMKNTYAPKAVFKQRHVIHNEIVYLYEFLSHRITAWGHLSVQNLDPFT
jgi:hypothetical protein